MRIAFVALLIVGSCGGGQPDSGTGSTSGSAQTSQPGLEAPHPTQATLYWDPVIKPPVDGYRIHYGTGSGAYTTHIDAGNVTSWTVQNLSPGTYYFAVTSVKKGQGESGYSNEAWTTIKGGDGG